jgi:hypothetical protein
LIVDGLNTLTISMLDELVAGPAEAGQHGSEVRA